MKSLLLCWQTDAMLKVYTKLFRYLSQVMKKNNKRLYSWKIVSCEVMILEKITILGEFTFRVSKRMVCDL